MRTMIGGGTVGDGQQADSNNPDDTIPSPERQAQLEVAYQQNVAAGHPPYAGVAIKTLGELQWVMAKHNWSGNAHLLPGQERANLVGASLRDAHLPSVQLSGALLTQVNLLEASLPDANLSGSTLVHVGLWGANLSNADLSKADLTNAMLAHADLSRANLYQANLADADLAGAHLADADLLGATLTGADLHEATLTGATLSRANLTGAFLVKANLASAVLAEANLTQATLSEATLTGVRLLRATLVGADLRGSRLDVTTQLTKVQVDENMRLADVVWNGAPLTPIDWEAMPTLGDEAEARRSTGNDGQRKSRATRITEYAMAARAYRQLAASMRGQGMNETADRYAYRAQLMQCSVLRLRRQWGAALGSWLLDLVSGYGYKPVRSIVTYIATIAVFAALYWCVTNDISLTHGLFTQTLLWLHMTPPTASHQPLQPYEAVVVSMTSFHGRGFFQPVQTPGDKVAILAAIEAAVGLLIEIVFIATFTQRFFAR